MCVVGRPSTGKSTLTNALVGQKVTVTSNRPETTRRAVRTIVNHESGQLVLADMPDLHRPHTLLGKRFNDMVRDPLSNVDAIAICLPADEATSPGDHFLLSLVSKLASRKTSIVTAMTKSDLVGRTALARRLQDISKLADFAGVVPVSTVKRGRVELLASLLIERMPESPPLYPRDAMTDESEETLVTKLMREATLRDLCDKLPHSLAVTIDGIVGDHIRVSLHVERDSQKGIVIGRSGTQLKRIRVHVRKAIERLLDGEVNLDLHMKMTKDWQRDPKKMGQLGF